MKTYLVGGAVRDKLLGLPVKDRDWVVVGATPEKMLQLGYQQVGRDFPVFLHPQSKQEYALARTERKSGKGYKGFEVFATPQVTLEEDLLRRDLTINALAESESGELIDPYGGQADLEARILRHVSPAFAEDPLRVLRVARFAARFADLGFRVAPETMALMKEITHSGELTHLVPERIWQEMHAALSTAAPHVFFGLLRDCGALVVLMGELEALFGVPQPAHFHPEIDTGIHTFMVLQQAALLSQDPVVRFAALVHDLGKGTTPREIWPSHTGHEERSAVLIGNIGERLRIPNEYLELGILVSRFHTRCHRATRHSAGELLETLEHVDAFRRPDRFEQFLLACEADSRGRTGLENRPYPQAGLLRNLLSVLRGINNRELLAQHGNPDNAGPIIREACTKLIGQYLTSEQ